MLMTFSVPKFKDRIWDEIKIHSIREDKHKRWKVGMKIHMWMHSPRNVSKNPFQFAEAEVLDVYPIKISKLHRTITVEGTLTQEIAAAPEIIAKNDGFDSADEFFDWFGEFSGRLIFWKNLRRVER